jgi:CubicO group peptidase (beta-lactamase class C family)
LLAYIVEKVSGEHFGPFLRHNIFEALDMKDTGSEEYMEVVPHLATGYEPGVFGVDAAPIDDWWNNVGAGTIYSTVEDLYKWDRALYSDKLLMAGLRKKMFTQYLQGGYGYGWGFHERFGRKVIAHNGREPGFVADISRYVDDDAVTIVGGTLAQAPTTSSARIWVPFSSERSMRFLRNGPESHSTREHWTSLSVNTRCSPEISSL